MSDQNTPQQEPVDAAKGFEAAINAKEQIDSVPVTEVTSLAKEEQKTGQRQELPNAEEFVARAGASLIQNLKHLSNLIGAKRGGKYVVSRHGMNRLLVSILDLPQDGIPVLLNGQEEKMGFAIGQRIIADRFVITQHHINEQVKAMREEQLAKQKAALEAAQNTPVEEAKPLETSELTTQEEPAKV